MKAGFEFLEAGLQCVKPERVSESRYRVRESRESFGKLVLSFVTADLEFGQAERVCGSRLSSWKADRVCESSCQVRDSGRRVSDSRESL